MARQGRVYADFAKSQWCAEPKRLERLGYLASLSSLGALRDQIADLSARLTSPKRWITLPGWPRSSGSSALDAGDEAARFGVAHVHIVDLGQLE
jgi:hypothetical protein